MPREDDVRRTGGKLAAGIRIARLEDHGVNLRTARYVETPGNIEELAAVLIRTGGIVRVLCGGGPGFPERAGGIDEVLGALVALRVREVAATAEVLAGEGIGAGHHVPRGAPAER